MELRSEEVFTAMMYGGGLLDWLGMALSIAFHVTVAAILVLAAIGFFRSLFPGARKDNGKRKTEVLPKERYSKSEYIWRTIGE